MRALISALCLAFALGGLAAPAAFADEGCDYGSAKKKNDFETPPPAASSVPNKG